MIKRFYGGIFIDKDKLSCEGINYPIKLEYYKIYDNTNFNEEIKYGLEVIKTEYKDRNIIIENKEITRITNEEKVINQILKKFKDNEVTPITANYIIDDLNLDQTK